MNGSIWRKRQKRKKVSRAVGIYNEEWSGEAREDTECVQKNLEEPLQQGMKVAPVNRCSYSVQLTTTRLERTRGMRLSRGVRGLSRGICSSRRKPSILSCDYIVSMQKWRKKTRQYRERQYVRENLRIKSCTGCKQTCTVYSVYEDKMLENTVLRKSHQIHVVQYMYLWKSARVYQIQGQRRFNL